MSNNFKKQKIVGDGISGADMMSHIGATDPHAGKYLTPAELDTHKNAELAHTEHLLPRTEVIENYNDLANSGKVVTAGAIKEINDRLVTLSQSMELAPGGYSVYRMNKHIPKFLSNSAYYESTIIPPDGLLAFKDSSTGELSCDSCYILNGKLYNMNNVEQKIKGNQQVDTLWTYVTVETSQYVHTLAINDGKLYLRFFRDDIDEVNDVWCSNDFAQIVFTDESFNTGWTYAYITSTSINYITNSDQSTVHYGIRIHAVKSNTLYMITVLFQNVDGNTDEDDARLLAFQTQHVYQCSNPSAVTIKNTSKELENIRLILRLGRHPNPIHHVAISTANSMFLINELEADILPSLLNIPVYGRPNKIIGVDNNGNLFKIVVNEDGTYTKQLIYEIAEGYNKVVYVGNSVVYFLSNNELYRLEIDTESCWHVDASSIENSKWTDIANLQSNENNVEEIIAINNGDLYHIKDFNTVTKLTNTKDWSSLQGAYHGVFAFKKNDGFVNLPSNVITTDNLTQEYVDNNAKIITADVLTQFRNEFITHMHDEVYVPVSHLNVSEDVHSQYVLKENLVNAGVHVMNPNHNDIPVFKANLMEADTTRISISTGVDYADAIIDNPSSTGNARVWKAILDYDNTYVNRFVKVTIDESDVITSEVEANNLAGVGDQSIVSMGNCTSSPSSLYVVDGKLFSTGIELGDPLTGDTPTDEPLNDEDGWTLVTGFTARNGFVAPSCKAVGINNGIAYAIRGYDTDGEGFIQEVANSPIGNWSKLTGTLYTNSARVWGICDGKICVIYETDTNPPEAVVLDDERTYDDCTVSNINSTTSNYCYAIADGKIHEVVFDIETKTILSNELVFRLSNTGKHNVNIIKVFGGKGISNSNNGSLLALKNDGYLFGINTYASKAYGFLYDRDTDYNNSKYGWTAACLNYAIKNGKLYKLTNTYDSYRSKSILGMGTSIAEVLIGGTSSDKWTQIYGCTSSTKNNMNKVIMMNEELFKCYYVGICDNKPYIISGLNAIPITSDSVVSMTGSVAYPLKDYLYRIPLSIATSANSGMELGVISPEHPNKWVITKKVDDKTTVLAVSSDKASEKEPWETAWSPEATVRLDLSEIGYWDKVPLSSVFQDATSTTKGVSKPKLEGGITISNGELSVSESVPNIKILKKNSIPVYGYETHGGDLIVSRGLPSKPRLVRTNLSQTSLDRVWTNFDENGSSKLAILDGATMDKVPLGEPITSITSVSDTSVSSNYVIVNSKLYHITYNNMLIIVDNDDWTCVCGMHSVSGSINTYAYGIKGGKLYRLSGTTATVIDSGSEGWTQLCGYSSNNSPNFYAYGIRAGNLYRIGNSTVTQITGKTGTWVRISGISGTYHGHPCTAYGVIKISDTSYELCALTDTATTVDTSDTEYQELTGYTYMDSLAYAIKNGYVYKLTPTGAIGLSSIPRWTKLSGLGYMNSGCCYGICNQNLYAIRDTTITVVDGGMGWTHIVGDYNRAYRREAYGIKNGHIYSLKEFKAVLLTEDNGWTHISGRENTIGRVVAAKTNEPEYRISANDDGVWQLDLHENDEYTLIAVSLESAAGTEPWSCRWNNYVKVTDDISHTGWSGYPITNFLTSDLLHTEIDILRTNLELMIDERLNTADFEANIAQYSPTSKFPPAMQEYLMYEEPEVEEGEEPPEPPGEPYLTSADATENYVTKQVLPPALLTYVETEPPEVIEGEEPPKPIPEPYVTPEVAQALYTITSKLPPALIEFITNNSDENPLGEPYLTSFAAAGYPLLDNLPPLIKNFIMNNSDENPLGEPYLPMTAVTAYTLTEKLPPALKTFIENNSEENPLGEPYITIEAFNTYEEEHVLTNYVQIEDLNNALMFYLKIADIENNGIVTTTNLQYQLSLIGMSPGNYVTENQLNMYVKSSTLGNTLISLNSALAEVNTNLMELASMLMSGTSGSTGGDYVTTLQMNTAIDNAKLQMNTAIDNAKKEPISVTTLSSSTTTCTMQPGKLYIWTVNATGRTLTASGFSSTGMEYGYLEVTIGASGSISVSSSITQVNSFISEATNFCILRNVKGSLRLTIVDTY